MKKLEIDTRGFGSKLPILIMFQDGEEYLRFPPKDKEVKTVNYKATEINRYFDIEK